MRVGDITYFAPSIPFAEVDLSGDALPEQIRTELRFTEGKPRKTS